MKPTLLAAALLAYFLLVPPSAAQIVESTQDARVAITFTPGERSAIDQFLRIHPSMLQANCVTLQLAPAACAKSRKEWLQSVEIANAKPQSQYATWGYYSHHESPDLVIPFFSKTTVNNWGWRHWEIVVFVPIGHDRYKATTAVTGTWGVCFDGMLYHPTRKRVEFWCNSMGGSIGWNGTTFIGKIENGD